MRHASAKRSRWRRAGWGPSSRKPHAGPSGARGGPCRPDRIPAWPRRRRSRPRRPSHGSRHGVRGGGGRGEPRRRRRRGRDPVRADHPVHAMAVRVQGRPGRRGLRDLDQGGLGAGGKGARGRNDFRRSRRPTDGNRDSTPPATPSDETLSDDTGKDEAEDAVPDAQGNEGETDATPEPKNGADGELDGEDVLSIPESREIGDDQAEREALIGQFGARTQMRDTYYPNLASFVELHVANMWPYQQGVMTKFLWVPDWWRYPPLIYQLDALWRAYETPDAAGPDDDLQHPGVRPARPGCSTRTPASWPRSASTRTGTRPGPGEPLPCERPPKGWRRKAMEPLRPVRPKEMEEAAAAIPDRERPPRRPNIKTARDR